MATAQTLQVTLEFDATGAVKSAKSAADGFDKMGKEAEKGRGMVAKLGSGLLSFGKGVLSALTSLKALVVAFAAFASVRVVANSLLAVTEQIDALNDRAAQLNVTTEALSALGTAAQLNGSSFEGMAAALSKLSLNIGMAAEGSKETTAIFKRLGVAFKDANGDIRATDDVLLDVADGLQRLGSQAERSRVAAQLFGREAGPRLLQLLSQGKAGIEAMRKEAEFFGVVISTKLAGDIADFRDSLDRLGFAFQGIRIALTERLIVPLTDYINGIATVIASARARIVEFLASMLESFANFAIKAGNFLTGLFDADFRSAVYDEIYALLKGLAAVADGVVSDIFDGVNKKASFVLRVIESSVFKFLGWVGKQVSALLSDLGGKAVEFARAIQSLQFAAAQAAIIGITTAVGKFADSMDRAGQSSAEAAKVSAEGTAAFGRAVDQLAAPFGRFGAAIAELSQSGAISGLIAGLKELGAAIKQTGVEAEQAAPKLTYLQRTAQNVGATFKGVGEGISSSLDNFKKQSLGTATQTEAAFTGLFNSAKSAATSFFESVISGNMTAKDAFNAFIKSMISALISLAAQMIVMIGLALILNALGFGMPAATTGVANITAATGNIAAASAATGGLQSSAGGGQTLVGSSASKSFPRIAPSTLGQPSNTNVTINAMDAKSFAAFASSPENARTMQSVVNGRNATTV